MKRFALILSLSSILAACGGKAATPSEAPAAPVKAEPSPEAKSGPSNKKAVCLQTMTRERDCTAEFIPALVDTRIRNDVPSGIAQEAQASGRQAIIDQAMEEWKVDSSDPKIEETCTKVESMMTPEQEAQMIPVAEGCLAKQSCGEFVACIMPLHEATLK